MTHSGLNSIVPINMRPNPLVMKFLLLLLLSGAAFQLPAQQAEANRKLFVEIKEFAEKGNAQAQYYLGDCYNLGVGVTTNRTEAVKWWRKAAGQGYATAQYNVGSSYASGDGIETNLVEAGKWFRKAADQGHAGAQFNVGISYANGIGVTKDRVEAVKWWQKSAVQGYAEAQYILGVCYLNGDGTPKDLVEAIKLLRKAAEQNHALAQNALGASFANGDGVRKDYVEAYKWFNLASAQDNELAKENLSNLDSLLTPEQVAEAQRLARGFKPRKTPKPNSIITGEGIMDSNPAASGTGFFITDDGYLISNYHVVKDATQVRLVTSAGFISAKVVKVDAANDLALLKAEGKFSPLPISPSRSAQLGSTVATIGFPDIGLQGFAPKLAKGEIASLSGAADDARYFQISLPVQPGNSGGALVDEHGNVVGIVSAKLDAATALAASGSLPENVNYAVKSSFLLSFLESVPAVSARLKEPITADRKFEDVVKSAQDSAVLVLVY
jgi:TPR repeat protein